MSGDDEEEKSFEPTQRKLDEARKRGEIARAPDVATAASYLGLFLAALWAGETVMTQVATISQSLLAQSDHVSSQMSLNGRAEIGPVLSAYGAALGPLFAAPFLCVILALVAQRAFVFAPDKLTFRVSRISPIETAKQKFGVDGLFSFAKSTLKMLAIGVILSFYLGARADEIADSMRLPAAMGIALMLRLLVEFLFLILVLAIIVGGADFYWQQAQHLKRNRMSHKEIMDEHKESEGDPHTKGLRRQRGQEIAMNRMLQDVDKADVIIVNPTHYAVALRWKRSDRHAPICVAKGVDEMAARIRERAALAGVPLHSDPPTARAIHAAVDVGQPVLPEHYKPVAAAIRFAEALKKHHKGWQ